MNRAAQLSALLLLCAASAHAQLYKSIGPDGKVMYSDTPPASAARVETKTVVHSGANTADLPFELREATRHHPVTLYTTKNCPACDDGRKLLNGRGVPFSEKTVNTNEDVIQFKQVGGESQLPLLIIGRTKEQGYSAGAWNTALSAAGYPEKNRLPKSYRQAEAAPAAPVPAPSVAKQEKPGERTPPAPMPAQTDLPPAVGNAPPGFRF